MTSCAFLGPTPSMSMSTRCQLTASMGLATTRKWASRSFTCAVSINLTPPRFSQRAVRDARVRSQDRMNESSTGITPPSRRVEPLAPATPKSSCDEPRLGILPCRLHQNRHRPIELPREEVLAVLFRRRFNDGIREIQNRLGAGDSLPAYRWWRRERVTGIP